jgi:hypothetical protein
VSNVRSDRHGPYEILAPLSANRMGEVYNGIDLPIPPIARVVLPPAAHDRIVREHFLNLSVGTASALRTRSPPHRR